MEILGSYTIIADNVPAKIEIIKRPEEYTPVYDVKFPTIEPATQAVLDSLKERLIDIVKIEISEILDPKVMEEIKQRFLESAKTAISQELTTVSENEKNILAGTLVHEMLGLGRLEIVLNDDNLEEVVINNSSEAVWVFHKKWGWLKTNIIVPTEEQIYNYASVIGRKVGRQITNLNPLMDAHLITGDRVNATLFPISTKGNTITIRKFRREPWTIVHFIDPVQKTMTKEIAALLWLCMQYELNILVSGGTASGKCVSGDTKILMNDGRLKEAKDVVEKVLEKDGCIECEDGIYSFTNDLEILTLDNNLKIQPKKVTCVWKRKAPEHLIRVKTKTGREVEVTPEHPFFIVNNGSIEGIRADQISKGIQIATPRKVDILANIDLDILDYIEDFYINSKDFKEVLKEIKNKLLTKYRSIKNASKKIGINYGSLRCNLSLQNNIKVSLLKKLCETTNIDWKNIRNKIKKVKPKTSSKFVTIPSINSSLLEIVGYIAGDGHIAKDSESVFFNNSDIKLRRRFMELVKEAFNIESKEEKPKNRVEKIAVHSSVVKEILKRVFEIPQGKKARIISLKNVDQLPNDMSSSLLKALFTCESNVNVNKGEIEFSTASKNLAEQIAFLLQRFGIVCRVKEKLYKNRIYYRIFIAGKNDLTLFKQIDFSDEKSEKLLSAIKDISHSNFDVIPNISKTITELKEKYNLTDKEIATFAGLSRRAIGRYRFGERRPKQETLKKIVYAFNKYTDGGELDLLTKLSDSDVLWDEVVEVKKVKSKEEWVYDLTVDPTHNFIAGSNGGILVHNTSVLNALMPFIPPNHRIISIEDTRELRLPDFLHWIPLTTREPNPEGKGEVSMLDLLVNSLRMRPDRIVVGEIRRQREAEVLFEAMHTGHSVYATLHADRAEQVIRRLTNPPIDVPESMLESLHLVIVQYRHRRLGIRRTLEVAEFIPGETGKFGSRLEILYRWKPTTDTIEKARSSIRLINEIRLHTGMTDEQMEDDLKEKESILQWMLDNNVRTVNTVGKVVAEYYHDRNKVLKIVKAKGKPEEVIGKTLAEELKTAV